MGEGVQPTATLEGRPAIWKEALRVGLLPGRCLRGAKVSTSSSPLSSLSELGHLWKLVRFVLQNFSL